MRARPIEPGFHVADAQEIALAYDGESLGRHQCSS
jgi:hypothetical protein